MRGTIAAVKDNYGFINADDGQSYFFHGSEVVDDTFYSVAVGDAVQFEPTKAERGPKAVKVVVVDSAG